MLLTSRSANDPTSIMSPFYTGSSCIPGFDANAPCKLGGYPEYVVNATSAQQIQTAVNFARTHKIRLVIKNTGHDFAGKSSGAGALSIWTHNLKNITYIPKYNSARYNGPAFKAGSGVQAFELYQAAKAYNVTAVGGEGEVSMYHPYSLLAANFAPRPWVLWEATLRLAATPR